MVTSIYSLFVCLGIIYLFRREGTVSYFSCDYYRFVIIIVTCFNFALETQNYSSTKPKPKPKPNRNWSNCHFSLETVGGELNKDWIEGGKR